MCTEKGDYGDSFPLPYSTITPLHLSGNTTASQNAQLQEYLGEAVHTAYLVSIEQLDRLSAQTVLDAGKKLKAEVAASVVEIIHRHTASDKFKDEQVGSNRDLSAHLPGAANRGPGHGVEEALSVAGQLHGKAGAQAAAGGRGGLVRDSPLAGAGPYLQRGCRRWCWGFWPQSASFKTASSAAWDRPTCARVSAPSWPKRFWPTSSKDRTFWCCRAVRHVASRLLGPPRPPARWPATSSALGAFAVACMLLTHPERLSSRRHADDRLRRRRVLGARRHYLRPRAPASTSTSPASSSASSMRTGRGICGARPRGFCTSLD